MRKNTNDAITAFLSGGSSRNNSISCVNGAIFSYDTCLAVSLDDEWYVLNVTKYSSTTSQQQNAIEAALPKFPTVKVDGLPRGCTIADVRKLGMIAINNRAHEAVTGKVITDGKTVYGVFNLSDGSKVDLHTQLESLSAMRKEK